MSEPKLDPLALVLRRWKSVLVLMLLGTAGGAVYGFVMPSWYSASLSVVPSQHVQDAAAMLASKLPFALDNIQTDVQRIQAVLTSNSVADDVIKKFELEDRYDVSHIEHARKALWKHCGTSVDKKSGVVTLTCEDRDPQRAMDMAAHFGEVGNRVFGRVSSSSAHEERKFLEAQVVKARQDVDEASRKLREFQEQHKIIDLPEQTKAVISAMAQMKGEMLSKQLELSYLRGFSSGEESGVVQLQQQIAILDKKITQLEDKGGTVRPTGAAATGSGGGTSGSSGTFFPDAMSVPALRYELEQLMRDQKIQETVFGLMTQRFEMAKVDEARDTSTFQILDYPTLPTYRSRPSRSKCALVGLLIGWGFALVWTVLPTWWRQRVKPLVQP